MQKGYTGTDTALQYLFDNATEVEAEQVLENRADHRIGARAHAEPLVKERAGLLERQRVHLVALFLRHAGPHFLEQHELGFMPSADGVHQRAVAIEHEPAGIIEQLEHGGPFQSPRLDDYTLGLG